MNDRSETSASLALGRLPDEAVIPTRLVLEDAAFDEVVRLLLDPPRPSEALVELMRGRVG